MDLRDYAPDSLAFEMKMHLFGLGWHRGSVKGGRVLIFRLINALQKDFPVRERHGSYQNGERNERAAARTGKWGFKDRLFEPGGGGRRRILRHHLVDQERTDEIRRDRFITGLVQVRPVL
jgi:hypothetical protein